MIDDELRTLVSVAPPAGFEARTRSRIRVDGAPARWRLPHAAMALAAALVVAVGMGLVSRSARQPDAPPAESPIAQRAVPSPAAAAPVATTATTTALPRVAAQTRRRTVRGAIVADTHVSRPQVQIDLAESLALQQLFASPVSGTVVDVGPLPASELLFIPPIAIEPLTLELRSEGASQ